MPPAIGVYLQRLDFDVVHAKDSGMLGASDDQIMDLARQQERTLITFDKHFADLVLYPPGTHWGVIRIRIHPPLLSDVIQALHQFLKHFQMSTNSGDVDRFGKGWLSHSESLVDLMALTGRFELDRNAESLIMV
ncbi:MAG: DUF5615 family PIN-like protein [Syntrophobacteraceae bacterium]